MTTKTPQSIDVNQPNYRVYSHAGEWIQGPILCPRTGNFEKVLVTLRTNTLRTSFTYNSNNNYRHGKKIQNLAEKLATKYHAHIDPCHFMKFSNIPIGVGLGSSTSDLVAFTFAYLHELGVRLTHLQTYQMATEYEGYSDPLYDSRTFLFNSKSKKELYSLPSIGKKYKAALTFSKQVREIVTDELQFNYTQEDIEKFKVIEAAFRRGITTANFKMIFAAADASAVQNQHQMSLDDYDEIKDICSRYAMGFSISHSGSAIVIHAEDQNLALVRKVLAGEGYESKKITISL